jgi:hypothetical protein
VTLVVCVIVRRIAFRMNIKIQSAGCWLFG